MQGYGQGYVLGTCAELCVRMGAGLCAGLPLCRFRRSRASLGTRRRHSGTDSGPQFCCTRSRSCAFGSTGWGHASGSTQCCRRSLTPRARLGYKIRARGCLDNVLDSLCPHGHSTSSPAELHPLRRSLYHWDGYSGPKQPARCLTTKLQQYCVRTPASQEGQARLTTQQ